MNGYLKQQGFSVVEMLFVLAFVSLVGFVGYKVYDTRSSLDNQYQNSASISSQAAVIKTPAIPSIKSTADLDKATQALNQVNPEDSNSDLSYVDSQLSGL